MGSARAYFIGQRLLLSDQPLWRQWPVRFVNWLVGWNGGPEIQGSAITFTTDRAIQLSSKHGYFKMQVPVDTGEINSSLPEEAVRYGDNEDQFPLSPQTFIYRHGEALEVKPCAQILAEQKGVEALINQVDGIRKKLKAHPAVL